ncbi:MAG: hypothetical protein OSB19_04190 [Opitutaceae bacterium]|nr:hypothetical protein [Opitutaceae bacterium]
MPSQKPTPEAEERLSQLLRMKRQERPDADFWNKFDEELRSKQLSALVRTQSWYERLGKTSLVIARRSTTATATVSVFALGIFAVSKSEYFANNDLEATQPSVAATNEAVALNATNAAPLFVVEEHFVAALEPEEPVFIQSFDAQPLYEIHTLTQRASSSNYSINAAPKQFTVGGQANGTSLGAQVIRTGNQF